MNKNCVISNEPVALFNKALTEVVAGNESAHALSEGQPYISALKNHFGIELDVPYENLRPLV
jgi:N-hydroxyarylamine O-acetyltransferase